MTAKDSWVNPSFLAIAFAWSSARSAATADGTAETWLAWSFGVVISYPQPLKPVLTLGFYGTTKRALTRSEHIPHSCL